MEIVVFPHCPLIVKARIRRMLLQDRGAKSSTHALQHPVNECPQCTDPKTTHCFPATVERKIRGLEERAGVFGISNANGIEDDIS